MIPQENKTKKNSFLDIITISDWLTLALIILSVISLIFHPEHFSNIGLSVGIMSSYFKLRRPILTGLLFIVSGVLQDLFVFLPTTRPATASFLFYFTTVLLSLGWCAVGILIIFERFRSPKKP